MVYDLAIIGLGAMGSAAAFHASRIGKTVIGFEQFRPAHDRGSSHGETRLTRQAYFEHRHYVPLLLRAHNLWNELNEITGQNLFVKSGIVLFGPGQGKDSVVQRCKMSAEAHGLDYQSLKFEEWRKQYPQFQPPSSLEAFWEPGAGYLFVEKIIEAHLQLAKKHGADLRFQQPIQRWKAEKNQDIVIETAEGKIKAQSLIITAGSWSSSVLKDLALPLTVHRNLLFWLPCPRTFESLPSFAMDLPEGFIYGFPSLGAGEFKIGMHRPGDRVDDPGQVERQLKPGDADWIADLIPRLIPGAGSQVLKHKVCLYTMTPDQHFIVDRHPHFPQVQFAAGFSGHGFKFSSLIGEALVQRALGRDYPLSLDFLSLKRFKPVH